MLLVDPKEALQFKSYLIFPIYGHLTRKPVLSDFSPVLTLPYPIRENLVWKTDATLGFTIGKHIATFSVVCTLGYKNSCLNIFTWSPNILYSKTLH